jgi:Flagellar hook-length control protein FliK
MPTVGQIRMQAEASGVNAASSRSGLRPDSKAAPVGFEAFLSALDRSTASRRNVQSDSSRTAPSGAFAMQNLPTIGSQAGDSAKITDPMQILMAQLAAQGLLNTALQTPNQQNTAATDSASNIQSLMGLVNGQQLDAKQTALISQALIKAMKASGQGAELAMQGQAASLLQALQQQSLGQPNAQTPAQIASTIQSLAQKNGITLPPEIQTQLTDLINKGADTGAIKLLGIEGAGQQNSAAVLDQAGVVDPTKATTIQNLVDPKAAGALTSAGEKLAKSKTNDALLSPGALIDKRQIAKTGTPMMSASALDAKGAVEAQSLPRSERQEFKETLNLSEIAANNGNLARMETQHLGNQQKMELKASEVSLASGPLHEQVMNAAKSGGGRIMLELTPPESGTIRIDLRIDQAGRAHLIVEGASDATKARLDQGGQNLKNEFAQMGLNLSLDLRQGGQSHQAQEQGFSGSRQGFYNGQSAIPQSSNTTLAIASVRSGDNREKSNTVHLYA